MQQETSELQHRIADLEKQLQQQQLLQEVQMTNAQSECARLQQESSELQHRVAERERELEVYLICIRVYLRFIMSFAIAGCLGWFWNDLISETFYADYNIRNIMP